VGDASLVGGADRELLEESARPRHRLIRMVGREHDAVDAAELKQQIQEGGGKIEA
jgi:hypothetical protein